MNIIRWIIEALNPCIHMDALVATMHDNPREPKITTTIVQCEVCGRIKKETIIAQQCGGGGLHTWRTDNVSRLYPVGTKSSNTDALPIGEIVRQTCTKCGDVRRIKLGGASEKKQEEA